MYDEWGERNRRTCSVRRHHLGKVWMCYRLRISEFNLILSGTETASNKKPNRKRGSLSHRYFDLTASLVLPRVAARSISSNTTRAISRARYGGTAFPTCPYCCVRVPSKK